MLDRVLKEWGTLEVFKQESDMIRSASEGKSAWRAGGGVVMERYQRRGGHLGGRVDGGLNQRWWQAWRGEVDGLEWMECGGKWMGWTHPQAFDLKKT